MKLSTTLKTLLATAIAFAGVSNAVQASNDSLAQIKENGVIRIGVFGDKPPFGYVDANGKNQGFDKPIQHNHH